MNNSSRVAVPKLKIITHFSSLQTLVCFIIISYHTHFGNAKRQRRRQRWPMRIKIINRCVMWSTVFIIGMVANMRAAIMKCGKFQSIDTSNANTLENTAKSISTNKGILWGLNFGVDVFVIHSSPRPGSTKLIWNGTHNKPHNTSPHERTLSWILENQKNHIKYVARIHLIRGSLLVSVCRFGIAILFASPCRVSAFYLRTSKYARFIISPAAHVSKVQIKKSTDQNWGKNIHMKTRPIVSLWCVCVRVVAMYSIKRFPWFQDNLKVHFMCVSICVYVRWKFILGT